MVGKEDFKVRIMHVMDSHVDGVIFGAGIRSVLHFVEFDVGEVFYDLDFLDFPILSHDVIDVAFVHFRETGNEQLSH